MSDIVYYEQVPQVMPLRFPQGDGLIIHTQASMNLTGYTFEAKILGTPTIVLTVTNVDLANGLVDIVLHTTDSTTLTIGGDYRWYFTWIYGGEKRMMISGKVEVIEVQTV